MKKESSLLLPALATVAGIYFLYKMDSPWWGYVIASIIILCVVGGKMESKKIAEAKEESLKKLQNQGIEIDRLIKVGDYVGGHPDVNSFLKGIQVYKDNGDFHLYAHFEDKSDISNIKMEFEKKATIPLERIKNITIEDHTTIDKRISVGRLMLFGPLALGMRKTTKSEEAFLCISWNDGKFDHETLFQLSNMQNANIARNALIKETREVIK